MHGQVFDRGPSVSACVLEAVATPVHVGVRPQFVVGHDPDSRLGHVFERATRGPPAPLFVTRIVDRVRVRVEETLHQPCIRD